ncbi:MAG: type II toxin-antitoxin system prevent-host-death family antitoxin [Burkholderiales bacterium]|nr:type II toxin-antitoxin system prevent-host-death family antitoxin [Burkholderiales bacterium]
MSVSATDAKNRFGQVLEEARKGPVFIEKAGRRHSVVLSVEHYEQLLRAAEPALDASAKRFYEQHKDWVDLCNELVEAHGVFGEEYRRW